MVGGAALRVVFFGTPEFAVPTLDDLLFQMELWAETILAEYGAKVTV